MSRDQLWAILGVVVGLLGAVVTVAIYYRTEREQTKKLQATVISETSLINTDIHTPSRLTIFYEGKDVPNVSLLSIRFANSGGQPITSEDIERPIQVQLSNCQQLISADITKEQPPDLTVTPTVNGSSVVLSKALLNPGDEFTLELTGVPYAGKHLSVQQVNARIIGMRGQVKLQTALPSSTAINYNSLYLPIIASVVALLGNVIVERVVRLFA
jgi:hypothetical protein